MPNDSSILAGLIIFFIAMGVLMPFIHDAFSNTVTITNIELLETESFNAGEQANNSQADCYWLFLPGRPTLICPEAVADETVNAINIITSILKMFIWTFGQVPFFIDLLLLEPLRILGYFLTYRALRSGAG